MKSDVGWNCEDCLCSGEISEQCPLISKATRWIEANKTEIGDRFFEVVAEDYVKIWPGEYRPFMLAWCDLFGGI